MNRSQMNRSQRSPLRGPLNRSMQSTRSPLRQSTRSPMRTMNRSVGGSLATTAQPAVAAENRFPANPTPETKLRLVFNELDLDQTKKVTLDHFRRVLKALNIAFTAATVEDLFERADKDKAGGINYSEFLNFAQHYPLLIEALYSRSREVFERVIREGDVQRQREQQEELHRVERLLQQQWDAAKDELNVQQRAFEAMEASTNNASQSLKDRNKDLVTAQHDLDRAKAERTVKERDLSDARDNERLALKPLRDMERNVDMAQERLTHAELQLDACREKERQLDAMLEEAKRETQGQVNMVTEINDNLAEMRERVAELAMVHEDSQREVTRANQEFQDCDAAVRSVRQDVEMMDKLKNEAAALLKQLTASLEEERRALIPFRQRESHQKSLHDDGRKKLEEADRKLMDLEGNLAAYDAGRVDVEAAEHPLLENEVRLREQRTNLNDRDDVLWGEGGTFLQAAQRSDTRIGTTNGRTRGI